MKEWSDHERRIARRAFDRAYRKECSSVLLQLKEMAAGTSEPADLFEMRRFINGRAKEISGKYDYRYSVLLNVFARLVSEGWLDFEDLRGLGEDKLGRIKVIADFRV